MHSIFITFDEFGVHHIHVRCKQCTSCIFISESFRTPWTRYFYKNQILYFSLFFFQYQFVCLHSYFEAFKWMKKFHTLFLIITYVYEVGEREKKNSQLNILFEIFYYYLCWVCRFTHRSHSINESQKKNCIFYNWDE